MFFLLLWLLVWETGDARTNNIDVNIFREIIAHFVPKFADFWF